MNQGSYVSHAIISDVLGLARAQSPGLGLALVGLGFGNPEPGPNSGLAKARGLARAQARAYIPYMVIIADSFKRHLEVEKVREISNRDCTNTISHMFWECIQ